MDKAYYETSQPTALGGIKKLRRGTGESQARVLDFLRAQDTYSLYAPARTRFPRRKIVAYQKHELHQVDLMDLQSLAKYNSGFRYILVCVDVLSKFVFYIPVKNKKAAEMKRAFLKIYRTAKPKHTLSDRGQEFFSREMQKFFRYHGVNHYHTYSEVKASQSERQIRTLRAALMRLFHHRGSWRYVDALQHLANNYNATPHSATGIPPKDVNATNEAAVFQKLFGGPRRYSLRPKFQVGDSVRISKLKGIFQKSSTQRWTHEVFFVARVRLTDPVTYVLKDLHDVELLGSFYAFELQKVTKGPESLWEVEKVLKKRRTADGQLEYLVRWRGYDQTHDSWVTHLQRK